MIRFGRRKVRDRAWQQEPRPGSSSQVAKLNQPKPRKKNMRWDRGTGPDYRQNGWQLSGLAENQPNVRYWGALSTGSSCGKRPFRLWAVSGLSPFQAPCGESGHVKLDYLDGWIWAGCLQSDSGNKTTFLRWRHFILPCFSQEAPALPTSNLPSSRRRYSATIRGILAIGSTVMLRNQVSAPSD